MRDLKVIEKEIKQFSKTHKKELTEAEEAAFGLLLDERAEVLSKLSGMNIKSLSGLGKEFQEFLSSRK